MEKNLSKRELNKARHKTAILDAAEKLFLAKGFDATSIDDVAKEARLTKRTLYQYFTSKEDLFYAVALKAARILTESYETEISRGKTALEKIRFANGAFLEFYRKYHGLFILLNYQPSNRQNSEASQSFQELQLLDGVRMRYFAEIIREAKADGSINPGLDTKKAVFFAFFASFSLLNMLSSMQGAWDVLGLDEDDFIRFCFDMLVSALK
jgi:AcrR family transcriptional regulator